MATNSQFQGLKDALNNSIKSLRKWHGRANSTAPAYFICLGKLFFYFTTLMLRLTSHCESLTQISRTCTFGTNGTASGMLPAWSSLKMWWVLQSHASSIYWHYCLVWQVFHCTHSKYDDGRWECPRYVRNTFQLCSRLTSKHKWAALLHQNHLFIMVVPIFSMPSKPFKSRTMLQGGLEMSSANTLKLGLSEQRISLVGGG